MLNTALICRPWSCHSPKVEGFEPQINNVDEPLDMARNYGRPTEMLWCRLCGHLEDK